MNLDSRHRARRRRHRRRSEFDGGVRAAGARGAARPIDGQAVLYGMRPEHCALGGDDGLPAEVVVVEPTGADTQLYCRFNGQELTSLVRDRVTVAPATASASRPTSSAPICSTRRAEPRLAA